MNKIEIIIKVTDPEGVQTTKFNVNKVDIEQFRDIEPVYNEEGQICNFEEGDEGITLVITAKLETSCEN
jgi:hypothetical protein